MSSSSESISATVVYRQRNEERVWRDTVALTKALLTVQLTSGIGIFKHVCGKMARRYVIRFNKNLVDLIGPSASGV